MKRSHLDVTVKTLAAFAALLILGGCSVKPRPPVFNLYNFQRMAVVPLLNESQDPALAGDVQDVLTTQVVRLSACKVVEAAQVAPYLMGMGKNTVDVPGDAALMGKIGTKFKSDILMTGSVTSYEETREITEPKRVVKSTKTVKDPKAGKDDKGRTVEVAEWGFYLDRKVTVAATAKLFDPATGSLLWTQKSSGYSYFNEWHVLPIPGNLKVPPMGMVESAYKLAKFQVEQSGAMRNMKKGRDPLMYKRDKVMADLRTKAIASAASYLTADFHGRGNWTPTLQGNQ